MEIHYKVGNDLDLDEVIELYRDSTLGERRPISDPVRMGAMIRNSNLVITAWDGGSLVGIARALTDWVYATYLADLAVKRSSAKGHRQRTDSPSAGSMFSSDIADSHVRARRGGLLPKDWHGAPSCRLLAAQRSASGRAITIE